MRRNRQTAREQRVRGPLGENHRLKAGEIEARAKEDNGRYWILVYPELPLLSA
jgi:hypothetical protein